MKTYKVKTKVLITDEAEFEAENEEQAIKLAKEDLIGVLNLDLIEIQEITATEI